MSLYSQFVKEQIHSVPGATQTERMKNVAKLWQQHKAGKAGKAPRRRKRGKGAEDSVADTVAAAAPQDGGCCSSGSGRRRRGRKSGGEIVAEAAPVQWSGGALNPLASGSAGYRPSQTGLGIFSGLLSSIGLGFRPTADNNEAMHRSEPQAGGQAGGAALSNFVHDVEVAFNP